MAFDAPVPDPDAEIPVRDGEGRIVGSLRHVERRGRDGDVVAYIVDLDRRMANALGRSGSDTLLRIPPHCAYPQEDAVLLRSRLDELDADSAWMRLELVAIASAEEEEADAPGFAVAPLGMSPRADAQVGGKTAKESL